MNTPDQEKMQKLVAKLQREGRMPTLEQVLQAVGEARKVYGPKILKARKAAMANSAATRRSN